MSENKLWDQEYKVKSVPTSYRTEPSKAIPVFKAFLKSISLPFRGRILDIGCGSGRNGIYLAKLGLEVYGIDFSEQALIEFQTKADKDGMNQSIHLNKGSVTEKLPFPTGFFDFAFDGNTFFHVVDDNDRRNFRYELSRVMKKNGYFLTYTPIKGDPYYGPIADLNGLFVDPNTKTHGRLFSEIDLSEFFRNRFSVSFMKKLQPEDVIGGKKYKRRLLCLMLKNL